MTFLYAPLYKSVRSYVQTNNYNEQSSSDIKVISLEAWDSPPLPSPVSSAPSINLLVLYCAHVCYTILLLQLQFVVDRVNIY